MQLNIVTAQVSWHFAADRAEHNEKQWNMMTTVRRTNLFSPSDVLVQDYCIFCMMSKIATQSITAFHRSTHSFPFCNNINLHFSPSSCSGCSSGGSTWGVTELIHWVIATGGGWPNNISIWVCFVCVCVSERKHTLLKVEDIYWKESKGGRVEEKGTDNGLTVGCLCGWAGTPAEHHNWLWAIDSVTTPAVVVY